MSTVLNDPKSVHFSGGIFVGDYAHNLVALNIPDGVRMSLSFGFPKDSELTGMFNYHLKKLVMNDMMLEESARVRDDMDFLLAVMTQPDCEALFAEVVNFEPMRRATRENAFGRHKNFEICLKEKI